MPVKTKSCKDSAILKNGKKATNGDSLSVKKAVNSTVLKKMTPGDTLAVANILSLGKNLAAIVRMLKEVSECGINLRLIREDMFLKADVLPDIVSSLLIAHRLQQSLMSLRTTAALKNKKEQGYKLGRPFGSNSALLLDDYKDEIRQLLADGFSKEEIAERFHVCRSTVYNYVRNNLELLKGV